MGGRLVMDEEQLFLFEDDPVPEEISQDPYLCPFCGGKPHINRKIQATEVFLTKAIIPKRYERIKVYVYCGRCRARGPIVVRILKRSSEEEEMKLEAIRKWNEMRGRR